MLQKLIFYLLRVINLQIFLRFIYIYKLTESDPFNSVARFCNLSISLSLFSEALTLWECSSSHNKVTFYFYIFIFMYY